MLAACHAACSNPELDAELRIPEDPILKKIDGKYKKHGLFLLSFFDAQISRQRSYFGALKTCRENAAKGWGKLEDESPPTRHKLVQ
ncbi:MAG: hypothetical protein HY748_12095 [Elusimicrobia bacterium]|nr:hypothetical protein [Elusimicrobiota bacterium]